MRRFLPCLLLAASLVPVHPAASVPPGDDELSALLTAMGMGFTRKEMMTEMERSVQELMDSQEPELASWFNSTVDADSLVLVAFETHNDRLTAFQAARMNQLRAALSQEEVQELTAVFNRESVRHLFAVIAAPDSMTRAAGGEFYTEVQGQIHNELSQAAQAFEDYQSLLRNMDPGLEE